VLFICEVSNYLVYQGGTITWTWDGQFYGNSNSNQWNLDGSQHQIVVTVSQPGYKSNSSTATQPKQ
jgi:hypothetical protein